MNARKSHRALKVLVVLGAVVSLSLTACAPGGSGGDSQVNPDDVSTTVPSDPVTLSLAYTDDPPSEALIDGFTKKYPNVTIEAQQTAFGDYIKSVTRSMASDDPPDIAQYNPGAMRSLIPAGHVLKLDPYAEAYGWNDKIPASSLEVLRSDDQAKEFGTGGLYAAPGAMSVLGVFYNKNILQAAGVTEPPKTITEFEAAMKAVDKAGHQPLSLGALEVGGIHLWNALLNGLGDVDDYRDWVYGVDGATIETDAARKASETISTWVEAGYITESANATAGSDALANFTKGDSAFLVTGNWAAAEIEEAMGEDVGFFLMPGASADSPKIASGASVAYSISSKSENANVAAAFLDYLTSPEAAKIQLGTGFMPVAAESDEQGEGLTGDIVDGYGEVVEVNGIVPFPDFSAPGMIDRLTAGVQGLISKRTTSDDFLASLQSEWTGHHG